MKSETKTTQQYKLQSNKGIIEFFEYFSIDDMTEDKELVDFDHRLRNGYKNFKIFDN